MLAVWRAGGQADALHALPARAVLLQGGPCHFRRRRRALFWKARFNLESAVSAGGTMS